MFEKGAQEILNLTLKNASISLISTLKATAIKTVINSIPLSFALSGLSEFVNWLFCRF